MHWLFNAIALLLIVSGLIHLGYATGKLREDLRGVPSDLIRFLQFYSLVLIPADIAAGVGMFYRTNWGVYLAIAIAASQVPVHSLVIAAKRRVGVSPEWFRYVDIAVAVVLPLLYLLPSIRSAYHV